MKLVGLCSEKTVDRITRINRINMGMSSGVLIHFQSHVRDLCMRKIVRAMRVTKCMADTAQGWTEPRARGVTISKKYRR